MVSVRTGTLTAALAVVGLAVAAQAAKWDSVGVFWQTEKTVVAINERGANVWPGSRLHVLMDAVGAGETWDFTNAAETVVIRCARDANAAICTFRFVPGPGVGSSPRQIAADLALTELRAAGWPARDELTAQEFRNSNGDRFTAEIADGTLRFRASKR